MLKHEPLIKIRDIYFPRDLRVLTWFTRKNRLLCTRPLVSKEPSLFFEWTYFFHIFSFQTFVCFQITIKRPIFASEGPVENVQCALINICNNFFFSPSIPDVHDGTMKIVRSFFSPFLFPFDTYLQTLRFHPYHKPICQTRVKSECKFPSRTIWILKTKCLSAIAC